MIRDDLTLTKNKFISISIHIRQAAAFFVAGQYSESPTAAQ